MDCIEQTAAELRRRADELVARMNAAPLEMREASGDGLEMHPQLRAIIDQAGRLLSTANYLDTLGG